MFAGKHAALAQWFKIFIQAQSHAVFVSIRNAIFCQNSASILVGLLILPLLRFKLVLALGRQGQIAGEFNDDLFRWTKPFQQIVDNGPNLVDGNMHGRVGDLPIAFFVRIRRFSRAKGNRAFKDIAVIGESLVETFPSAALAVTAKAGLLDRIGIDGYIIFQKRQDRFQRLLA